MSNKVNIKARIKRHSRILKDNISNFSFSKNDKQNYWYNVVLFVMIFFIPIYPYISSMVYGNSYDFYRWDIDESSIIWSYYTSESSFVDENWPILESNDSFLSINTILDDKRDLSWTNEIIDYEVESGESISSIAYKFEVSTNSIYWANNFSKNHIIHPGDIIKVPPVSWLIHQIKSWDTLSSIAKKYNVDEIKIQEQNLLSLEDDIKVWDVLVIPWAIKIPDPVVVPKNTKTYANNTSSSSSSSSSSSWGYSFSNNALSQYSNTKWVYKLVWRAPQHTFYWWNCTWYVAQYKNVNWWWNAKDWLKNASWKWASTWSSPQLWSIVVFNWRWYNPRYGHVAIVMEIKWSDLIVSDMNYRKLWEVTYRKIPINDRAIIWYIYVD